MTIVLCIVLSAMYTAAVCSTVEQSFIIIIIIIIITIIIIIIDKINSDEMQFVLIHLNVNTSFNTAIVHQILEKYDKQWYIRQ